MAELLPQKQAEVVYCDPYVEWFAANGTPVERVELTAEELRKADVALIVTAHRVFDFDLVVKESDLAFDTRNVLKDRPGDNVIVL